MRLAAHAGLRGKWDAAPGASVVESKNTAKTDTPARADSSYNSAIPGEDR
jgi:hypothetical protein